MPNICGKTYAFTVITPIKRWRLWQLTIGFFLTAIFPKILGELKRCSFIFFAQWAIVNKLPHFGDPQPRENLRYRYLIFMSNFNGTWDGYFDTFSSVIAVNINDIWQSCVKFPGAVPVTPFKEYARRNQYDADYYYVAYPDASTSDVKAALHVQEEFDRLVNSTRGVSADGFQESYQSFLAQVQLNLGAIGPPTEPEEE